VPAGYRLRSPPDFRGSPEALPGNYRFVYRGDALDDFSIRPGTSSPALATTTSPARSWTRRPSRSSRPRGGGWRWRPSCLAQRVRLRFAAGFGHGFGESREQNGEPEPEGDLHFEAQAGGADEDVRIKKTVVSAAPDLYHEDHGILHEGHGIQLGEGILQARRRISGSNRARSNCLLRKSAAVASSFAGGESLSSPCLAQIGNTIEAKSFPLVHEEVLDQRT